MQTGFITLGCCLEAVARFAKYALPRSRLIQRFPQASSIRNCGFSQANRLVEIRDENGVSGDAATSQGELVALHRPGKGENRVPIKTDQPLRRRFYWCVC